MLQSLRNKMHGWPAVLVLGIAVIAMSFFGIESYFMSSGDTYVAKVGKHEISPNDFQVAMNNARQRMSAQMGDNFDSAAFESEQNKQRILDGLIDQQLLLQANSELGLVVSSEAVRDYILALPYLQVNGQYDQGAYRTFLSSQRITADQFEQQVRSSLEVQLLPDAISAGTLVTDADVERYLNLRMQRRDIRYVLLPRASVADEAVTDAQTGNYYKAHQADFTNPERVSLKYVEVNGADLKPETQPSDEELQKRYEQEKQKFIQPEQRLVSHILIEVPKNATPAQQKAALAKAEQLASQVTPSNFAKLAAQASDDLGSKRDGGDLGWLEKGVANPAFDAALFSMQKGQISKPVLSPEEGYHIIWLRDVRSGQAKPFAEVRDQLAKEAVSGSVDEQYRALASKLTDETYKNPESLDPASQDLKLPVKNTPLFDRKGGEGIAGNPSVIKAAFSDDVLVQGNNSDLIDLGDNHSVVIRVDKHVPAAVKPLAEVRDAIKQKIIDERIAAASKKQADDLLARLQKGEDLQAVAGNNPVKSFANLVRPPQQPNGVPDAIWAKAFLLPHPVNNKPQFGSVDMGDGSYALVAVDKVSDADLSKMTAQDREALRRQMTQFYAEQAAEAYLQALRGKTDIKIAKDRMQ